VEPLISPQTPPIEAVNISKSFFRKDGSQVVLFRHLSLSIAPGEILGLMGASGQGKSSLGNILLGLLSPEEGKILWQKKSLKGLPPEEYRCLRPRYQKVYQDPSASFFPGHTLYRTFQDFFRWGRRPELSRKEEWESSLRKGMEQAALSEKLLQRYPWQLSGGELQRFALLRALLFDPFFLVADEPTSRLDASVQARVARFLTEEARKRGVAVLFISHHQALLEVLCSRILQLREK